jgi:uncharacterized RDD family membrane protein YckC
MARDENPYAPPGDDGEPPPSSGDDRTPFEPASRGVRFAGALIDGLFNLAVICTVMAAAGELSSLFSVSGRQHLGVTYWAASGAVLALQGALITRSGQSLGKLLMRTRIVLQDGRTAGLEHGFLLRMIPVTVVSLTPTVLLNLGVDAASVTTLNMLLSVVVLADALWIFGAHRRCLHDLIAGTCVAVVGSQREPRPPRQKRKKKRKVASAG